MSPIKPNLDTSTPSQRLYIVENHVDSTKLAHRAGHRVLLLPTGAEVTAITAGGTTIHISLDSLPISRYTSLDNPPLALVITSVNTPFENVETHLPKQPVIEISAPDVDDDTIRTISIPDFWVTLYTLFTLLPEAEHIPAIFSSVENGPQLRQYLLTTGLGRLQSGKGLHQSVIFLSRGAFWQGAGVQGYHDRGWPQWHPPLFPALPSFTRTDRVIASHPLRPPKPQPGQVLYRRWCAGVGQMLEFTYFDLDGETDSKGEAVNDTTVSRHLAAFHKWHNDERVNKAWDKRGSIEEHRKYLEDTLANPAVLPCMMSWDGELMGYLEMVWIKENHAAQHYPTGFVVGDWERGLHVLVGEERFTGGGRAEIWLRSILHYFFLADPRTDRVMGEPREDNTTIVRAVMKASFHKETTFDFPYKRSVLVLHPRERFFKSNRLHL